MLHSKRTWKPLICGIALAKICTLGFNNISHHTATMLIIMAPTLDVSLQKRPVKKTNSSINTNPPKKPKTQQPKAALTE